MAWIANTDFVKIELAETARGNVARELAKVMNNVMINPTIAFVFLGDAGTFNSLLLFYCFDKTFFTSLLIIPGIKLTALAPNNVQIARALRNAVKAQKDVTLQKTAWMVIVFPFLAKQTVFSRNS